MDRGAWWAIVHGAEKNQKQLVTKQEHTEACIKLLRRKLRIRRKLAEVSGTLNVS